MKRYQTEAEARLAACEASAANPDGEFYVIESPPRESTEEGVVRITNGGRFVMDDDGFVRSWERQIAVYRRGKERAS